MLGKLPSMALDSGFPAGMTEFLAAGLFFRSQAATAATVNQT